MISLIYYYSCTEKKVLKNKQYVIMLMKEFLIFLILVAQALKVTSTTDKELYLMRVLNHYEDVLNESYYSLLNIYDSSDGNCSFYRACENEDGFGVYPHDLLLTPDPTFNNQTTNRNHTLFKKSVTDSYDTQFDDICAINQLTDVWRENIETDLNALVWQYVGFPDGTFASYPYSNWSANNGCPGEYKPELRPWFIAASSSPKNIIILIDTSTSGDDYESRIYFEKEVAKKFIGSLSHKDFATVIQYSSYTVPYDNSLMTRMNIENVGYIQDYIDSIELSTSVSTDIPNALDKGLEILSNSRAEEYSSDCVDTVVLLTGGGSSIQNEDIDTVLERYEDTVDPMVFSFIYSPGNRNPAKSVPTKLACDTGGFVKIYSENEPDLDASLEEYSKFMESGVSGRNVRWSEVYEDAMGLGHMVTGSMPIYVEDELRSVVSMDLLISNVSNNGNISEIEIEQYLLDSNVCEDFNPPEELIEDDSTCTFNNTDIREDDPEYVKLGWLIALSMALLGCAFIALPIMYVFLWMKGAHQESKYRDTIKKNQMKIGTDNNALGYLQCVVTTLGGVSVVPWLWYLICFWLLMWNRIEMYNNWRAAPMTVELKEYNPYRCCDIVNCECSNYYGSSCSSLKASLTEGDCSNGYYCCYRVYYRCGRYSTCSYCGSSVSNRKCEVKCGTCYSPTVSVSFSVDDTLVNSAFSDSCGRDDKSCADNYLNSYPEIGGTIKGYYDPTEPDSVSESIDYTDESLGSVIPPIIIIVAFTVTQVAMIYMFHKRDRERVARIIKEKLKVINDQRVKDEKYKADIELAERVHREKIQRQYNSDMKNLRDILC
jgi:hypothetical protein